MVVKSIDYSPNDARERSDFSLKYLKTSGEFGGV